MAWSASPSNYFSAWAFDGVSDITLPITCVPNLDAVDCDPTTGDIRKVMFDLLEQVYITWTALPTADRSTRMTVSRSQSINQATTYITRSYTYTFVLAPVGIEVVDE